MLQGHVMLEHTHTHTHTDMNWDPFFSISIFNYFDLFLSIQMILSRSSSTDDR